MIPSSKKERDAATVLVNFVKTCNSISHVNVDYVLTGQSLTTQRAKSCQDQLISAAITNRAITLVKPHKQKASGLFALQGASSLYLREQGSALHDSFEPQFIDEHTNESQRSAHSYFVVNSRLVLDRLHTALRHQERRPNPQDLQRSAEILRGATCKSYGPGLALLRLAKLTADQTAEIKKLLSALGTKPSVAAIYHYLSGEKAIELDRHPILNNAHLWEEMLSGADYCNVKKRGHAPGDFTAMHRSVADLLLGLDQYMYDPALRQSMSIYESLKTIEPLLAVLHYRGNHHQHAVDAYQALLNEIYVLLSKIRPYTARDYEQAMRNRIPSYKHWPSSSQRRCFLASSGCDAITTAMAAAQRLRSHIAGNLGYYDQGQIFRLVSDSDRYMLYHEILPQVAKTTEHPARCPLLITPLHPNCSHNYDEYSSAESTIKRITSAVARAPESPTIVILDATVVLYPEEVDDVVAGLNDLINAGRLILMVCESHQKMNGLAAGIIYAGGITVLHKEQDYSAGLLNRLCEFEDALAIKDFAEFQLLTHMLRYGTESKRAAISSAVRAARQIRKAWPALPPSTPKVHDSYFAPYISDRYLSKQGEMSYFDSFSAPTTTYTVLNDCYRINCGQESPARVAELLTRHGHETPPLVTPEAQIEALSISRTTFDEIRTGARQLADMEYRELASGIFAIATHIDLANPAVARALCQCVGTLFMRTPEGISSPMLDALTYSTRNQLAELWFRSYFVSDPISDDAESILMLKSVMRFISSARMIEYVQTTVANGKFDALPLGIRTTITNMVHAATSRF